MAANPPALRFGPHSGGLENLDALNRVLLDLCTEGKTLRFVYL